MSEQTDVDQSVREWASEWADKFDQSWTDEAVEQFLGKTVRGRVETDEGPRGFDGALVVGHSLDRIWYKPDSNAEPAVVERRSILTADGKQLSILAGMEIVEVSVE